MIDETRYWWKPEEKGLTPEETEAKVEELWEQEISQSRNCPDCDVKSGSKHIGSCDVARCGSCGGQAISCGCKDSDIKWNNVWSGLWPGIRECYEQKLIVWSDPNRLGGTDWTFDLNELDRRRIFKKT